MVTRNMPSPFVHEIASNANRRRQLALPGSWVQTEHPPAATLRQPRRSTGSGLPRLRTQLRARQINSVTRSIERLVLKGPG
jgi:hypothetical protein